MAFESNLVLSWISDLIYNKFIPPSAAYNYWSSIAPFAPIPFIPTAADLIWFKISSA